MGWKAQSRNCYKARDSGAQADRGTPDYQGSERQKPGGQGFTGITKKQRKTGFWGPKKNPGIWRSQRVQEVGMRMCRDEGAHWQEREKGGGGRAKNEAGSLSVCPWCRSQLPAAYRPAHRIPDAVRRPTKSLRYLRPCLTLFAASQRPAACPPAAALRGPKSESCDAAGPPSS